ncbi:MAG: hypothetical protein DCC55_19105 [Chloroflexi bacterium]|nr:MAG: hypothetical protein DCC55_19105 [Chloroflexota bacterium]
MTTEIEFELPAIQYELMGYPGLKQGESLTVTLDAGVLLPDPAADGWFAVRKEPFPPLFKRVGPALYVFAGQIEQAELNNEAGEESAVLLVDCGLPLRVTCAPGEDGRLPYGTWETRSFTGFGRLHGLIEDDFATGIGKTIDVTIWGFQRLVLTPGDPVIGEWHTMDVLPPAPYRYDRVLIQARRHRDILHRLPL